MNDDDDDDDDGGDDIEIMMISDDIKLLLLICISDKHLSRSRALRSKWSRSSLRQPTGNMPWTF